MSPARDEQRPPLLPSAWYVLLAFALVFTAAILVMVAHRAESSSDFRDFWNNALHYRQTGEIASDRGVHNYLPFFTIFMTPWTFLPLRISAVLFALLSLLLFGLTARLTEVLLSDGRRRGPRAALLVTLALALPYVYACAVVGNVGLLVLFLVVATWFLVERGREWEAGVALGLATLIKLLPGVLLIFFLLKRRWRVPGAATAVILVLGLGWPLLTLGLEQTIAEHKGFYQRAALDHSAVQTITSDKPLKAHYNNNALPIVLRRLLSPLNGGTDDRGHPLLVNVADWPRGRILAVYAAIVVVLLSGSIVIALRKPRRWPPQNLAELSALRRQFGVWCGLMLLGSPLVWTHYFPLVYWPLAVVADGAAGSVQEGRRPSRLCLVTLAIWLTGAVLLAWPAARAAGAQLATVAWLWLALSWLSLHTKRK